MLSSILCLAELFYKLCVNTYKSLCANMDFNNNNIVYLLSLPVRKMSVTLNVKCRRVLGDLIYQLLYAPHAVLLRNEFR